MINRLFVTFTKCLAVLLLFALISTSCSDTNETVLTIEEGDSIAFLGGNFCSRAINFGHFEAALHQRYPNNHLIIRNMCDGGDTPGFRPHSSRDTPWAYPGAEKYQDEYAADSKSMGQFPDPDQWLTTLRTDVIIGFFGYSSSFNGPAGIDNFRGELRSFMDHTLSQKYNGIAAPKVALMSPPSLEDRSEEGFLTDGKTQNINLKLYTAVIEEVANEYNVPFINTYELSQELYKNHQLTIDGLQFNDRGYQLIADKIFGILTGKKSSIKKSDQVAIIEAVKEKNWMWHNDYKVPNGVHVYGRRFEPFGPDNYPYEIEKIKQLTAIRDTAIWAVMSGQDYDIASADLKTKVLPPVESNYIIEEGEGTARYLNGAEAEASIHTAPGYKMELFASEQEFPDLANPVQLSFDNAGRLWVAVMPSYPHYKPGDAKPNDKLLILEDTDNDGKADKQTIFADGLHLPIGFEFAPEGVYVSQGTNLKLYKDTDGDDKADEVEIVFSGFDDHDTHHAISAFCADPMGAIYMAEGCFLHTNVETSNGTIRNTYAGFYKLDPKRRDLKRIAQVNIPNPWSIAFDKWGQSLYGVTSGPAVHWMLPGTVKPLYADYTPTTEELIEEKHRVRPTSGIEFIYSSHFPPSDQGDFLINNTIGFLGAKQHSLKDDGTGYKSNFKQDLFWSDDKNFRPVDMEFAPDGSLYIVDWHNILVGHMQHNARDPLRDHVHGRIYRVTYPSRPLVTPAKVAGASIETLLENLRLPEYRTKYRTRRELRGRDSDEVIAAISSWVSSIPAEDKEREQLLLEVLWVTAGINRVDKDILNTLLNAENYKIRAAALEVLRSNGHHISNQEQLLAKAAQDEHGRVRLEAITAASWLEDKSAANNILDIASTKPTDKWIEGALATAKAHVNGEPLVKEADKEIKSHLIGGNLEIYKKGKEIYEREGYCGTCHQLDGKGLKASGFPPLAGTKWVTQGDERMIKLTLKGIYGPIEVLGDQYPGQVPMTPYENLLNDEELSAVLTYVRNSWGNKSSVIYPARIKVIREKIKDKKGFYTPEELLAEHPHRNQ